ncbi:hypothetical protein pdam_00024519, partial [Pocillopora damicornis]
ISMNVRRTHTIALSFQGVRTEMVAMNVPVKTVIEKNLMELVQKFAFQSVKKIYIVREEIVCAGGAFIWAQT